MVKVWELKASSKAPSGTFAGGMKGPREIVCGMKMSMTLFSGHLTADPSAATSPVPTPPDGVMLRIGTVTSIADGSACLCAWSVQNIEMIGALTGGTPSS